MDMILLALEETPGINDRDVLFRAQKEARIVLTLDRDYGELISLQIFCSRHYLFSFSSDHAGRTC